MAGPITPADPAVAVGGIDPATGLSWWQREPAVILGAVTSLAAIGVSLGVISDGQQRAIVAAVTAILALGAAFLARSKVVPAKKAAAATVLAAKRVQQQADLDHAEIAGQAAYHEEQAGNAQSMLAVFQHAALAEQQPTGPSPDSALHPLAVTPPIGGFPE